jgi:proline-specific peptidase
MLDLPGRLAIPLTLALLIPCALCAQDPVPTRVGTRLPVPGGTIWYRAGGSQGEVPLVVLHGGPGIPSVYLKSLDALEDERIVVRYDQLGAGYSDVVEDTALFTIDRFVQELDSLRSHLGLERMHVYGHSWGSILALEYYRAHPTRVASLVLASPVVDMRAFFANVPKLIGAISPAALQALELQEKGQPFDTVAFRTGLGEFNRRHVQRTMPRPDADTMRTLENRAVAAHLNGSRILHPDGALKDYDATPFLAEIRVPVLYLVGENDFSGPDIAARFASLTPAARLVVLPGSGHMMTWDSPAAHADAVRAFLREVDRR